MEESLWGPRLGEEFLDMILKASSIKEKFDKVDFTKIKNLCSISVPDKRMKLEVTDLKTVFANHTSDRLIFRL